MLNTVDFSAANKRNLSLLALGWLLILSTSRLNAQGRPFLSRLNDLDTLTSTVPGNGDVNPYGVAIVPVTTGKLVENEVLVSNFNNSKNLQGTGTTIVQISPAGVRTPFAKIDAASLAPGACPGGVGLTTALVALRSGFVIVGTLPTADGMAPTAQAGCLIILDSNATVVGTISGNGINGPWDMTAVDTDAGAILFVTNVFNGTVAANGAVVSMGSVLRISLSIPASGMPSATFTTIASAFDERTDPAALVIGPTGVALAADGTLFVADTVQSRIAAIPNALSRMDDAGAGVTVAQGGPIKGPLGLTLAPNGNILTVNANDGLIVETTPGGQQKGARFVDVSHSRNGAGTLFGLAVGPGGTSVYLVNDGNNTLTILQ
jgi:hypothetical protein